MKPTLVELLEPLAWMLPPWCQSCTVFYTDDGDNNHLQCGASIVAHSDYVYRRMSLTFFPNFFSQPREAQREMCIHDLLHCITGILADWAQAEIQRLCSPEDAPKYNATLMEELNRRHEAMTQDLAFVIHNYVRKSEATIAESSTR